MGNAPSTETSRKSLPSRPPLSAHASLPLPPLPPVPPNKSKLSKPRSRPYSTAGLLKSTDSSARTTTNTATSPLSRRPTLSRIQTARTHIAAAIAGSSPPSPSPNSPQTPSFLADAALNSRPLPPVPTPASPALSANVFTFEEAVAAVHSQNDSIPWQPVSSSVYQTPNIDLELYQEQQNRQLDFEKRQNQWQSQFQFQFKEQPEQRLKDKQKQRQKQGSVPGRKRSVLFRSRSTRRAAQPTDEELFSFQRRNSIDSANLYSAGWNSWGNDPTYDPVQSQYYGSALTESWSQPAGSRSSWNYNLSSYEAKRLLHIVNDTMPADNGVEQNSAASESKLSVLSEGTRRSSDPALPDVPALHRVSSDISLYAPVRRRSIMQVPGIATRRNSSSSIMAGGTSGGVGIIRPDFRHSTSDPTAPGVYHRASFESSASRILSMPPLPRANFHDRATEESVPRPLTPCEGDYNAIGAFKLGSLRITNGVDTPSSPETTKTRRTADDNENSDSPNSDGVIHSPALRIAARTQALAALSANNPAIEGDDDVETKPLKDSTTNQVSQIDTKLDQSSQASLKSSSPSQLLPSPIIVDSAKPRSPTEFVVPATPAPTANEAEGASVELPHLPIDLFAGFDFSPFSLEEAASVPPADPSQDALQTTSKTTAVEDRLFDEESIAPEYTADETLDVRADSSAKSALPSRVATVRGSVKSTRTRSTQSVARSDSGFVSSPTSEASQKPLSKADSGYGSNVSLKSFKHAASKLMGPVAAVKAASLAATDKDSSSSARSSQRESFFIDELKLPSPTFDSPDMNFLSTDFVSSPLKETPSVPTELPLPQSQSTTAAMPSPPHREAPRPPMPPVSASRPVSSSAVSAKTTDTSRPAPSIASTHASRLSIPTSIFRKRHTVAAPLDSNVPPVPAIVADNSAPGTPVSTKPDGPGLLVTGSGAQRTNRLLRLLGVGSNHSSSTDATEPEIEQEQAEDDEAEAETEAVAAEAPESEEKLHEHTGLSPIHTKGLALKPQLSNNTLKTIFSVGSMEGQSTADLHQTVVNMPPAAAFASSAVSPVAEESNSPELHASSKPAKQQVQQSTSQVAPPTLASSTSAKEQPVKKVTHRRSFLGRRLKDKTESDGKNDKNDKTGEAKEAKKSKKEHKAKKGAQPAKPHEGGVSPSPENILEVEAELTTYGSINNSLGNNPYDAAFIAMHGDTDPFPPRPVRTGRTMSLTAQLERSLNMRLSFPRFSRSTPDDASPSADEPETSPSLPSPVFAEILEQQRRLSLRSDVARPSMKQTMAVQVPRMARALRVPPPLRSQSTPPRSKSIPPVDMRSPSSSLESFHSAASNQQQNASAAASTVSVDDVAAIAASMTATSPAMIVSPVQEADGSIAGQGRQTRSRRPSMASAYTGEPGYNRPEAYGSRSDFGGSYDHSRTNSMVSVRSTTSLGYRGASGPPVSFVPMPRSYSPAPQPGRTYSPAPGRSSPTPNSLRHRASYEGFNQMGHDAPAYNPPSMSNGYTDPYTRRSRSGSGGSTMTASSAAANTTSTTTTASSFANMYQQRQQAAWEYYYQQNSHPPPYVPRAYHNRNRSSGDGHQAPYRILHSYNSPAYRGVPIWG